MGDVDGIGEGSAGGGGGAMPFTVTDAEATALPPAPVQLRVNVEEAFRLPVDWLPEVALAPLQLPPAVQEVALVELQFRVEPEPEAIELGLADMEIVGAGGGIRGGGVTVPPYSSAPTSTGEDLVWPSISVVGNPDEPPALIAKTPAFK